MRSTQMYGHTKEAMDFLKQYVVRKNVCPHCYKHDGWETKKIGTTGMFGEVSLLEYKLKDGRTAKESVQYSPWSSGPMVFLKIEVSDGTIFEWKIEDAEEACGEGFETGKKYGLAAEGVCCGGCGLYFGDDGEKYLCNICGYTYCERCMSDKAGLCWVCNNMLRKSEK